MPRGNPNPTATAAAGGTPNTGSGGGNSGTPSWLRALGGGGSGGGGGGGGGKADRLKKKVRGEVAAGGAQFYSSGHTVKVGGSAPDGGTGNGSAPLSRSNSKRLSASSRDPSVLVQVQIEYWHPVTGKWSQGGSVKAKRDEVILDLPVDAQVEERSVKFLLDSSLRVEHATPLCINFHLIICGTGGRHRVAVYSEGEGQDLLRVLRQQGGQVIRRRSLPPCLPLPKLPPKPPSSKNLRPISEGHILNLSKVEEEEGVVGKESEDEIIMRVNPDGSRVLIRRRKSTGSSDDHPSLRKLKSKSEILPRSGSTGVNWRGQDDPEEEGRGLSTGSTRKSLVQRQRSRQRSDQSLNSDEVSSGSFGVQDQHFGSQSSLATASSEDDPDGVFGGGVKVFRTSTRRDQDFDDDKLEKYKFMLVNIEDDPSVIDPAALGAGEGDYKRCCFDDYPDLAVPDDLPDAPVNLESQPRWIRKSFEELDLDVSNTEHEAKRKSTSSSSSTKKKSSSNRHRYLRQTSSLLEPPPLTSTRLDSVESEVSTPTSPTPPPPLLARQSSRSKKHHHPSSSSSSSSKSERKKSREKKQQVMVDDGRAAEQV